jgi:hypothetical protein
VSAISRAAGPPPTTSARLRGSGKRRPPEEKEHPVDHHEEDDQRPRERVRRGQEVERRERPELEKERRHEEPAERLAEALVLAVQADEREREHLHRHDESHVPDPETDVLGREKPVRPGERDLRPDQKGAVERGDREGHVSGERREPERGERPPGGHAASRTRRDDRPAGHRNGAASRAVRGQAGLR